MNASVMRWCSQRLVLPLALALVLGVAVQTQAQDQPPTPPSGNTRQPIVTNQFNTVNGGALQQRRPGLFVQQGTSVHNGNMSFFDGNVVDERSFVGQMVRDIFVTVLDSINQALALLAGPFGGNSLLGDLINQLGASGVKPVVTEATPTITETTPDLTPAPTVLQPDAPPAP